MWSYYGSKSKIINLYPAPKHAVIHEPFAGSARYSLRFFEKEIYLSDLDENVINIWHYLQKCSPSDILGLPRFKEGDNIKDFNLSKEELLFCGFLIAKGASSPQFQATKWTTSKQPTWIPYQLRRIAENLFKIKHWNIRLQSYLDIPNMDATWFIDPPYQFGGQYYRCSNKNIDFTKLADWCKGRDGQVLVCENTKANWLDFQPLKEMQGSLYKTTEALWSNEKIAAKPQQFDLFQSLNIHAA